MKKLRTFAALSVTAITLLGCATTSERYYQSKIDLTAITASSILERQSWKDINPHIH